MLLFSLDRMRGRKEHERKQPIAGRKKNEELMYVEGGNTSVFIGQEI